ncbi:putative phosphohistidine phosphatase, SixA [Acidimicrobium ferrooxidans DSM 10331]|uniref:Putative phosphohistidine phosphatase, SixA n=1 Tax=Acidimicrobium ferrooxidans (strain DSM 10331 / JCM 15462 / NBRC 103882 / ICP) TaxID=525909 RepID=C7LZG1_ACIFD|nr:histidine phosphatase family protein [Acidimicrobium ferrooxidans]ACU54119.1 putative phosphohistidine phosphatase, SixA [Acidimicrobium ferrooxidans DSM 10331]
MLVVARHAPATRPRPGMADLERSLTEEGLVKAQALSVELVRLAPTHLVSSPARRCIETLAPLAKALDLEIITDDGLGPSAKAPQIAMSLAYLGALDGVTVVATHAPQLEVLLEQLLADHGISVDADALHLPPAGYVIVDVAEGVRPPRIDRVRAYRDVGTDPLLLVG